MKISHLRSFSAVYSLSVASSMTLSLMALSSSVFAAAGKNAPMNPNAKPTAALEKPVATPSELKRNCVMNRGMMVIDQFFPRFEAKMGGASQAKKPMGEVAAMLGLPQSDIQNCLQVGNMNCQEGVLLHRSGHQLSMTCTPRRAGQSGNTANPGADSKEIQEAK